MLAIETMSEIPIDQQPHFSTQLQVGSFGYGDQVIVAVGVSPNPLVPQSIEGLELGRKNTIAVKVGLQ